jgi:hypothetical protein
LQGRRPRIFALVVLAALVVTGCAQSPWSPASASAELFVVDGTRRQYVGGTCERGSTDRDTDYFVLSVGRPSRGDAASIDIELDELTGGAVFAGDGSGDGVLVQYDGRRWGLARNPHAIRFDEELNGGSVRLVELDGAGNPREGNWATLDFRC